jgi:26 proteasome complex subunit DSS1
MVSALKEFEGSNWEDLSGQVEGVQLFQDDWEDDNANDDFTEQLRAQISNNAST